jgi:cytochrome b6-f complex iron-sulfur subunit
VDKEKNPTPPGESAPDKPRADGEPTAAGGHGEARPGPSVEELLDASRGDVKPRPAAKTSAAPPAKTPAAPPAKTPVTPSAREASANTTAEAAPAGDAPGKAVPASTPAAARVSPATGASKTTSTPTPSVNKGVSAGVAAKVPAATKAAGASAAAVPPAAGADTPMNKMRRRIVWASIAGFLVTSFLMFLRFFLPRAIFEPSNVFRVGFPGDYGIGVDTKWQQQYRIWVVRNTERLFVITAVCTHLGCTPDWKESENKFKCPCHGSGYDSEGVNFEGPAPRPMDRAHVELDAEGQIVVNKDRVYKWEKGKESQFDETGAFIRVG